MQILSKILRFSWQEQIQKIKLLEYYTKKGPKQIWTNLSLLEQEPTFKPCDTGNSGPKAWVIPNLVILND